MIQYQATAVRCQSNIYFDMSFERIQRCIYFVCLFSKMFLGHSTTTNNVLYFQFTPKCFVGNTFWENSATPWP